MRNLAFILFFVLSFISCSVSNDPEKVLFISVARTYGEAGSSNYLPNTVNDQRAIREEIEYLSIESSYVYDEMIFTEENGVRTVNGTDEEWSMSSFIDYLFSLSLSSNDLIIFHYSGHADTEGRFVLNDDIYDRLEGSDLIHALSGIGCKVFMVIDACYSGVFSVNTGVLSGSEVFSGNSYSYSSFAVSFSSSFVSFFTGKVSGNGNIWAMSASTSLQTSYDRWHGGLANQEDYGAFSYYFLKALGYDFENLEPGRLESGRISVFSLYRKILDIYPPELRFNESPQVTLTLRDLTLFN